jgi:hypothetical protein
VINERDIAEKFTPVWHEVLPLLTANFMRVFNESHIVMLPGSLKVKSTGHPDVISEYAYHLTRLSYERGVELNDELGKDIKIEAFEASLGSILRSRRVTDIPEALNDVESNEGILLARNTRSFLNTLNDGTIVFGPTLPGYGIIASCAADVSIGKSLFEIKTVKRTFRSKDLKQLILYLALQSVTGQRKWEFAGLYNPRLGVYCRFNIDGMIGTLSGNRPPQEVFRDLLELLVRDVQFEKRF